MSHAFQKRDRNGKPCKTVYIGYKDRIGRYVQEATKSLTSPRGGGSLRNSSGARSGSG